MGCLQLLLGWSRVGQGELSITALQCPHPSPKVDVPRHRVLGWFDVPSSHHRSSAPGTAVHPKRKGHVPSSLVSPMSLHCTGSMAQGTMSPAPACKEQPPTTVPKAWPWQSDPWAPSVQEPVWGNCDPAFCRGRGQTTAVPQEWDQGEPLNPRWGVGRGQWCGGRG